MLRFCARLHAHAAMHAVRARAIEQAKQGRERGPAALGRRASASLPLALTRLV
jgi:hypothetical protein